MDETYTYTARSPEHPEQTLTFTLRNEHMSVDLSTPVEQVERMLQSRRDADEEPAASRDEGGLWFKPLAVSLLERGVGPFYINDVSAVAREDQLRIRAWYRAGGLGLVPITLINSRIDNPEAAHAFVHEIARRKEEASAPTGPVALLDYWLTWLVAIAGLIVLVNFWRNR
ncbi:MAG: hypothetical protein P8129_04025 [Anaerolineae bacterium]|jgi:hypothetical protein